MAISREQIVAQSVQEFIKDQLFNVRGLSADTQVQVLDAFNPKVGVPQPVEKTYVATGFHFDEGALAAEIGSSLKTRNYVIEFFVFGLDATWGENIASTVRDCVQSQQDRIPLLDIGTAGHPVMDYLLVLTCSGRREPLPDPQPWEENLWTVNVSVQDEYYSDLL